MLLVLFQIPSSAVEMPRNISSVPNVQMDLQFGAWDMPAENTTVGGGFSFGAPAITAANPSNTYTSPAR